MKFGVYCTLLLSGFLLVLVYGPQPQDYWLKQQEARADEPAPHPAKVTIYSSAETWQSYRAQNVKPVGEHVEFWDVDTKQRRAVYGTFVVTWEGDE